MAFLLLFLVLPFSPQAWASEATKKIGNKDVYETLSSHSETRLFLNALKRLNVNLHLPCRYVLLAANNAAFAELSRNTLEQLEYRDEHWRKYIFRHVSCEAPSQSPTKPIALDGKPIKIEKRQGHLWANGARVVRVISASNGIIYELAQLRSKDPFFRRKASGPKEELMPSSL